MPQHLASKDAISSINDQDYDPMSKQAPQASDWSLSRGKAKQYSERCRLRTSQHTRRLTKLTFSPRSG